VGVVESAAFPLHFEVDGEHPFFPILFTQEVSQQAAQQTGTGNDVQPTACLGSSFDEEQP
jgi:hypothetical protein